MIEKIYKTDKGDIHYWVSETVRSEDITLVFLPGLTADHRLFEKQIAYFTDKMNVFVWDAPGHAASWPFQLDFTLFDKAKWLEEILCLERIEKPVIVGQSMGGYVGQAYAECYPDRLKGFISIDSAPLQRAYVTSVEIWLLKHTQAMYRVYPWKSLLKAGTKGVATTQYGQDLMREMMMVYDGQQERYASLAGHGYRMLAEAMEADRAYEIRCPALLICGTEDHAGSCLRYNRAWHRKTDLPMEWIEGAGHNSNTDAPERVNGLIEHIAEICSKNLG